jgi:thioredoxin-like negative regulator of GroEL
MMELMLEAERALAVGLNDQAERLYRQVVAADPRNSIAVVGLARVALERGDERGAYIEARRALALDPDNPMASHLVMRMAELMRRRGEEVPSDVVAAAAPEPASPTPTAANAAAGGRPTGESGTDVRDAGAVPAKAGPSLLDRLFRRGR